MNVERNAGMIFFFKQTVHVNDLVNTKAIKNLFITTEP